MSAAELIEMKRDAIKATRKAVRLAITLHKVTLPEVGPERTVWQSELDHLQQTEHNLTVRLNAARSATRHGRAA